MTRYLARRRPCIQKSTSTRERHERTRSNRVGLFRPPGCGPDFQAPSAVRFCTAPPAGAHCIWKTISAVFQRPCCRVATFRSFDERSPYKMELAIADLSGSGTTPRARWALRLAAERTSRSRRAGLPERSLARDRTARPVARRVAIEAATSTRRSPRAPRALV